MGQKCYMRIYLDGVKCRRYGGFTKSTIEERFMEEFSSSYNSFVKFINSYAYYVHPERLDDNRGTYEVKFEFVKRNQDARIVFKTITYTMDKYPFHVRVKLASVSMVKKIESDTKEIVDNRCNEFLHRYRPNTKTSFGG